MYILIGYWNVSLAVSSDLIELMRSTVSERCRDGEKFLPSPRDIFDCDPDWTMEILFVRLPNPCKKSLPPTGTGTNGDTTTPSKDPSEQTNPPFKRRL